MNPLYRISLYLWLLLRDLPPVSTGRLLMPAIFACGWTILIALQTPPPLAFVWAGVLAQAAQAWWVLPSTVRRLRQRQISARGPVTAAMVFVVAVVTFQVWNAEPWVSQRLISLFMLFYAAMMAAGVGGDRDVLDTFAPVRGDADVPRGFRRYLLKLYALIALIAVAMNEATLVIDAPLGTRVAVLSLMPIMLHYCFEIILRLTCPRIDRMDD